MKQIIKNDAEMQEALKAGVNKIADVVAATMGPKGRNVLIESMYGTHHSTKDGVTVAKAVSLNDKTEDLAASVIKQAAGKVVKEAGDGTTTVMVLARELYNQCLKIIERDGISPTYLKRKLEKLNQELVEAVLSDATPINSDFNAIKQVATIAANNDETIGALIADAFNAVGEEGLVLSEESKGTETRVEVTNGAKFDRGFISPYFINTPKMTCEFENPLIFLHDKKLRSADEFLPVLKMAASMNKPLVVIAEEVEAQTLGLLITNRMRGDFPIVAIKAPAWGERRFNVLNDIALITGANVITEKKGRTVSSTELEDLGTCEKIIVSRDEFIIIGNQATESDIKSRVEEIQNESTSVITQYEVEKNKERIATLRGKLAKIIIGAQTEVELKEKIDRVDDALKATQSALKQGVVEGGGSVFYKLSKYCLDQNTPEGEVMSKTLQAPIKQIISNAGLIPEVVLNHCERRGLGYNAYEDAYVDLKESGILDPALVLTSCLNNAVSVATNLTLTAATIVNEDTPAGPDVPEGFAENMM